ncbi:MAG: branched-chain amino acid ABC transporter permease, partial [Limisphaerales bacterium]
MVYGVLRFINFAHSDVFMVGAYSGFFIAPYLGSQSILTGLAVLAAAMVVCAILGMTIERLAYRPLRNSSKLNVLITAIGVSLLLQNAAQLFWKATPRSFPALFPNKTFHLEFVTISSNQVVVL